MQRLAHALLDGFELPCARELSCSSQHFPAVGTHQTQVPPSGGFQALGPLPHRTVAPCVISVPCVESARDEALLRGPPDDGVGKDRAGVLAALSSGKFHEIGEYGLASPLRL